MRKFGAKEGGWILIVENSGMNKAKIYQGHVEYILDGKATLRFYAQHGVADFYIEDVAVGDIDVDNQETNIQPGTPVRWDIGTLKFSVDKLSLWTAKQIQEAKEWAKEKMEVFDDIS